MFFFLIEEDTEEHQTASKQPVYNQKITPGCWCASQRQSLRINSQMLSVALKTPKYSVWSGLFVCFAEHVFALNATDNFLQKRAQGLPQSVVELMRYNQEEFIHRLKKYRQLSTAEETVLDYFDELEIYPQHIGIDLIAS